MGNKDQEEQSELLIEKVLETRTIILSAAVDSKLTDKVLKQILILEQEDSKAEIKVFINSPGGEIQSGFAIFDALKFVPCPITTVVVGLAASMGSILMLAADEGRRFAFPNARIMIHQPLLSGAQGPATDLEIHSRQIIKTRKLLAGIYSQYTGKSERQILKDLDRDHWLSAEDAIEYGLVNKIITSRSEL